MTPQSEEALDRQALLGQLGHDSLSGSDFDDSDHESYPLRELEDEQDVLQASQRGRTVRAYSEKSRASLPLLRLVRPSKFCILISLGIVSALLVAIVGEFFYIVYKVVPEDGQSPPFYPTPAGGTDQEWDHSYKKAAALVSRMSLMEKVNVTTGTNWASDLCVGNTAPATGVGFPALCLQDGPLGLRFSDHSTAWPAGIHVGATWNKDLMYQRGKHMGIEARGKGVNVILGPSVGPLGRMPAGGRNWEGFGADPVLQGVAAANTIRGIQEEGVIATIKHFVGNEQEHFRQSWEWGLPNAISTYIDDRTLHEMYGWPFLDAIKAGVASLMCSYNQVNSSYACGNSWLMNGVVKHEMGFQGFIQSDWLAKRSGVASALAGLDMDMPGDGLKWADGKTLWGQHLTQAVLNGSLPEDRLNDMVLRVVAAWYQMGQDDENKWPKQGPNGGDGPNFSSFTDAPEGKVHPSSDDNTTALVNKFVDVQGFGKDFHGRIAKTIAIEGTVLLKNEASVLPLNSTQLAIDAGLRKRKHKIGVFGEDAGPAENGPNGCPDRSCNEGTLAMGWGSGAVEFPYLRTPLQALQSAFDFEAVELAVDTSNSPKRKASKDQPSPADQDMCFVFSNSDAGEGFHSWNGVRGDRNDLRLQKNGDKLIKSVADWCGGPTVVVIHTVGPVVVEGWIKHPNIKAVLNAGLPGQESGNALTDVLFGHADPSGRLPYTMPKSEEDFGKAGKILYYPNSAIPTQEFNEGLLIDYRHFDQNNIEPRFEFGFGLSYTTFELSDAAITELKPKSLHAAPLPGSAPQAPIITPNLPLPHEALFPDGLRPLKSRSYPYLTTEDLKHAYPNGTDYPYPYPEGYLASAPQPRSRGAGGFQGGNPDLWTEHLQLSVTVTNTGEREGQQVVQLYIGFPDEVRDAVSGETVAFPPRMLRAFQKTAVLKPRETETIQLRLNRRDLSFWSTAQQEWQMVMSDVRIYVGISSRQIIHNMIW